MKFNNIHVNTDKRYALGRELESGRYYLSIPVSNPYVDYEEYYEIEQSLVEQYPDNEREMTLFADECRNRAHDNLLMHKPGKYRGIG